MTLLTRAEALLTRLIGIGEKLVREKERENDFRALTFSLSWLTRDEAAARLGMQPCRFTAWVEELGCFKAHKRTVDGRQVDAYFAEQIQQMLVVQRQNEQGTSTAEMIALRRPRARQEARVEQR